MRYQFRSWHFVDMARYEDERLKRTWDGRVFYEFAILEDARTDLPETGWSTMIPSQISSAVEQRPLIRQRSEHEPPAGARSH
jgi:hypothetical protein